jgi:hypothetical protein
MIQRICSALIRMCSAMILLAAMLTSIAPATLHAQDISGDWQGTLHAGTDLRVIVHIEKNVAEPKDTQKNAAEKKDDDKAGSKTLRKRKKKTQGKRRRKTPRRKMPGTLLAGKPRSTPSTRGLTAFRSAR